MSDEDAAFEALLDKLEEEFASVEDDSPPDRHQWEIEREVLFDKDSRKWRCSKCFVRLDVEDKESVNAAMKRQGVNANCAEQLLKEVDEY